MGLNLNKQAAEYTERVIGYEVGYGLPRELFSQPDHLAIKAKDIAQFEHLVRSLSSQAIETYCFEDQERFVAVAKFMGEISVAGGGVNWLEIKEPQPAKVGKDFAGVEHVEFYTDEFEEALGILRRKGLGPIVESYDQHHRVTVDLGDGHELRLTDTPIAAIVNERLNDDIYLLHAA